MSEQVRHKIRRSASFFKRVASATLKYLFCSLSRPEDVCNIKVHMITLFLTPFFSLWGLVYA